MSESAQKVISELTGAGLLSSDQVTRYADEIESGIDVLLDKLVNDGRITDFQRDKFKAGKSSDIYFGDYVVIEMLGQGGMGAVLLARHRRMDRKVAIKVLPVTVLESKDAVARFYQEVKVAAQLTHPNIVHAYDAGEHHGFHYLVMEYVPGHDLAEVLAQLGSVPLPMTLEYTKQACQGLDYAHRKGIVHRDIKPSNLLLNDEGTVKILDLGLARFGGSLFGQKANQLTTTGQVMGTVEYMSPEQAEDTRQADHRSDIYSLGCTMYRLLTGTSPFSRDTVVKTILAHRSDPIPKIETGFPEDIVVNDLFAKMVAKRPEDRFQSVAEILEVIDTIENGDVWQADRMLVNPSSAEATWVPSDSIEIVDHEINLPTTPRAAPADEDVIFLAGTAQAAASTERWWPAMLLIAMPIVALVLLLNAKTSLLVPFGISFVSWRWANKILTSPEPSGLANNNRRRTRRIKWASITINLLAVLGMLIQFLGPII